MHITTPDHGFASCPPLADNEVHLWRVDLSSAAQHGDHWESVLSSDELDRAQRYRFQKDRLQYTTVRGSLRSILAGYLKTDARELTFSYSSTGKPRLGPNWTQSGILFNVSHSGGAALLAFNKLGEIGVDIEKIRRDVELVTISRRFFSVHEQDRLAEIEADQRYEAFFRCWTRKEAYIKATGAGLSLSLDQFDVSVQPWAPQCLQETRPDSGEAARWSLVEVHAGEGFVGAICVQGKGWILRDWSHPDRLSQPLKDYGS